MVEYIRPQSNQPSVQPAQFAAVMLASGEGQPRKRARDQQGDLIGAELKNRILQIVVERAPSADEFPDALSAIIDELQVPSGPALAIARLIADEWETMAQYPQVTRWLLERAVDRHAEKRPTLEMESD